MKGVESFRWKGKDATTHYYEVVVPFDTPLNLSVQSNFYRLADQTGAAVNPSKGAQAPVQIPTGTAPPPVVYRSCENLRPVGLHSGRRGGRHGCSEHHDYGEKRPELRRSWPILWDVR